MKNKLKDSYNYIEEVEDTIDLIALTKKVWLARKLIVKVSTTFFIIGCVVASISPIVYESQITFVPQTSDQSSSSNKSLGSLASLAGINLNSETLSSLDNYLSPLLYSKIVESEEFSLSLIYEDLIFINSDSIKIKDYILKDLNKFNLLAFIKKYTLGLFTEDKKEEIIPYEILEEYNFISSDDYKIIKVFNEKFSIDLDKKEGYIRVIARDKDAFVSTQLVKLVTKNLQSRIISLRTNKIKEELVFSIEQYEKQKDKFEILQNYVAEFKDSNKNINTAVFLSKLQILESEYQLQQNILLTLASEYNNNKIKLNKDTPIFSVLDDISVPNEKSEPKKGKIVLIYIFLGLVSSVIYVLIKDSLKKNIQDIINSSN